MLGSRLAPWYKKGSRIPREDGEALGAEAFAQKYMARNEPVILQGLVGGWKAWRLWRRQKTRLDVKSEKSGPASAPTPTIGPTVKLQSSTEVKVDINLAGKSQPAGAPDLAHLAAVFGRARVRVAVCGQRDFSDQKRVDMTLGEFVAKWRKADTGCGGSRCNGSTGFYLKDWHMAREYPDYGAYTVPPHFADDWLNEHAAATRGDDFRFVYAGRAGTWTPLHRDVYCSYSWSANIVGHKFWILFPPDEARGLVDSRGDCVYDVTDVDATAKRDFKRRFPRFSTAASRCWVALQAPGEVIYVPSGWFHQVHNVTDAVSINHNWFNSWSLRRVWAHMREELSAALCALEGFTFDSFSSLLGPSSMSSSSESPATDPEALMRLMRANTGIDCAGFCELLCGVADRRAAKPRTTRELRVLVSVLGELREAWATWLGAKGRQACKSAIAKLRAALGPEAKCEERALGTRKEQPA